MWALVLMTCGVWGHALPQIEKEAGSVPVQWGWQMSQTGPGTVGQYFVKLPEAEQRVRYVADGSGYHSAVAVTTSDQDHLHTSNFALGDRALQLSSQIPPQIYNKPIAANGTREFGNSGVTRNQNPLQIFLLREQYIPAQEHFFQLIPNNPIQLTTTPNFFITDDPTPTPSYYKLNVEHSTNAYQHQTERKGKIQSNDKINTETSEEIIETKENGPVVRVFKDHKCQNDDLNNDYNFQEAFVTTLQKPNVNSKDSNHKKYSVHGNYGVREYSKETNSQRPSLPEARSGRYYSTEINYSTSTPVTFTEEEGISRLVASTQDLISNEDLLRINHAAEQVINSYGDDFIKPKRRLNPNTNFYHQIHKEIKPRNRITVTAKVGNIVDSTVEHPQNNFQEHSYETSKDDYRFASPIIVANPNYRNYKEQIVNNLLSTVVPYMQDGYEIIGVTNNLRKNSSNVNYENQLTEDLVNITPRPISQNYLTPITVAVRLLHANASDIYNTVDDHEGADTELIEKTIDKPKRGETIVEIQESVPVEITHINDVEYHEYLDEGRSNNENTFGMAKSLYQKYLQNFESSKITRNEYNNVNNQNLDLYENVRSEDSKEPLQSSENMQSEVQLHADSGNSAAYTNYYNNENREKIIQPIIIEKQVPITTYIDRFIEKKVPYPEPVEVVKQVPVDRPVPVPVHYERIVEKPVEVTKYVNKPFPFKVLKPYPVEVRVPYPVEHKVYVDRPVHVPFPVEKVIEKQFLQPIPIPTPVGIPVGIHVPVEKKVLYPIPIETPVPYPVPVEKHVPVEKIVEKEVPVPYPVEKKVPYPVRHEIKVPVPYPVEKRVPVPVEVHVPKPYPVDRIIEKKVPYPVTVERIVERKVKVPYPVKTVVEKIVEKPIVVTKYIEKPYPVEKRVPFPVEKIVERKVPYPVHVPVEVKVPYPAESNGPESNTPYPFEKVEKQTIYTYGINQDALTNVANYLRYNQEQYKQPLPNYVRGDIQYSTQQQAESQRNYQIQLANAQILRNLQNVTPVYLGQWGNQYASSYQYSNATLEAKSPATINTLDQENSQKYYGPPPLKNYNDQWEKHKEYSERLRRTDRAPKVTNLRIEYGGFKPPLIPSTEVDLAGVPINKEQP